MYVRLATKGPDYAKCSRAFPIEKKFEFPTVLAERELKGELLGYLTTSTESGYIVAGPLWILPSLSRTGKGLVLLRLMTGYESTLAINHIDRFLFWISPDQEHYIATIKKAIGLEPFEVDEEGNSWFRKMIVKETIE